MKIQPFRSDSPPKQYLRQVCEHCCKAAALYMDLWEKQDRYNKINVSSDDIRTEFLCSKQAFKHNLLLLAREGLINVEETAKGTKIEVVGWDNDDNLLTP